MSGLYDTDVLSWSEQQSALLRRVAAGEAPNERPDWPNIIEEVESVGSEVLHAVESLILQAFVHDLKAEGWPSATAVEHWREEARNFRAQASLRYVPSMRQRIDLARIHAKALRILPTSIDGAPPLALPSACPFATPEDVLELAGEHG